MRWDDLFADLEGQLAAEWRRHEQADLADRMRLARARVALVDRLAHAAGRGESVVMGLAGGLTLPGSLVDAGSDWVRLRAGGGQALVPVAAIITVRGLGRWSATAEGDVTRRFGLGQALRALGRDRAEVRVHTVTGAEHEGRIEWVAADHLTLSEQGGREGGRPSAPGGGLTVALPAVAAVRSS